jgi:hypothetical protein
MFGLVAVACSADDGSVMPSTGDGSTSTVTSSTGDTPLATDTGVATDTSGGSTTGTATTGGPADSTSAGESSSGGAPGVPRDCRTLLEAEPGSADGIYELHPGGDATAPPFSAYCDMTTDGGGWTLVGRSAMGTWTALQFGWGFATGTIEDEAMPYSLGAKDQQLQFNEMLVGIHAGANALGDYAYTMEVPDDFLIVYEKAPYETVPVPLLGDCDPKGGPAALRWVGWTDHDLLFSMSDDPDAVTDGLEPAMQDSNAANCDVGGMINGTLGILLVR